MDFGYAETGCRRKVFKEGGEMTVRKKRMLAAGAILLAVVIAVAAAGVYMYLHPEQQVGRWQSTNVEYPYITYHPYNRLFSTPAGLSEKSERFNDAVSAYVRDMTGKYGDSIELKYDLERGTILPA